MNVFDSIFKDNEFTLHWKECWPKLRPRLVEMQMYPPQGLNSPEDIGRRTLFLREIIEQFDKLNELPREGAALPRPKRLNMQHIHAASHAPQTSAKATRPQSSR